MANIPSAGRRSLERAVLQRVCHALATEQCDPPDFDAIRPYIHDPEHAAILDTCAKLSRIGLRGADLRNALPAELTIRGLPEIDYDTLFAEPSGPSLEEILHRLSNQPLR